MYIDDALVLKLENLAKLRLSEEERMTIRQELTSIIGMFAKISEVNTKGVKPLIHMSSGFNALREDSGAVSIDFEAIRVIAPALLERYFAVPKVIE